MGTLAGPDRRAALEAWGDWLAAGWSWDLFVTLTHDNSADALGRGTRTVVGWKASADRWDEFLAEGLAPLIPPGAGPVYWVRGREPNPWRKGTHFHALIGGCGDVNRRALWRWWFGEGERDETGKLRPTRYGLARILPYDPSRGAAHYLTKYVIKELGDIVFSDTMGRPSLRMAEQATPQGRTSAFDRWERLNSDEEYVRAWAFR